MAAVTYPSLEHVAADARAYPAQLLPDGGTGLCLFAAAFLGVNDAVHMALAGMRVTCVDTDEERLGEMSFKYPRDWRFVPADAWEFAENARADGELWDAVSVDTFTGEATDRSLATLELWCSLAHRVVTATIGRGQSFDCPEGWDSQRVTRSPLADWLVLTRA